MPYVKTINEDGVVSDIMAVALDPTLDATLLHKSELVNGFTQTTAGVNALDAAAGKSLNDSLSNCATKTELANIQGFAYARVARTNAAQTAAVMSAESILNGDTSLFSISSAGITILKSGYYEISGQSIIGTGFTVGDNAIIEIHVGTTMASKAQNKVGASASWQTLVIAPRILHISANTVVAMYCRNENGARGYIGNNNPVDDSLVVRCIKLD